MRASQSQMPERGGVRAQLIGDAPCPVPGDNARPDTANGDASISHNPAPNLKSNSLA